jgi:hypothetical protein
LLFGSDDISSLSIIYVRSGKFSINILDNPDNREVYIWMLQSTWMNQKLNVLAESKIVCALRKCYALVSLYWMLAEWVSASSVALGFHNILR